MPGKMINPRQRARYIQLRHHDGFTRAAACKKVGISESTGVRIDKDYTIDSARERQLDFAAESVPGPLRYDQLSETARQGWDDFEHFRRTFLGHISTPWQIETANTVVALLETDRKEFVVENCPPGAGKSTLIHDIACWVIVRNRRVRILFGSRTQGNADRLLKRVRRTLERMVPYRAPDDEKQRGVSCDCDMTLAEAYGLFRPVAAETWRGDEFIVAQYDDLPIEEKEPTCSSYGMDSGVLGNRFNLVFWDDVVDKTTIRTMEQTEQQRSWWDDEAETRLEPAGVMFLVGQRMAANDLYRYCLDKKLPLSEEDAEAAADLPEHERVELENQQSSKYRHVLYLAHYEDRCDPKITHKPGAQAYPDGCLLDPYRIGWRDCYDIMHTKTQTWRVQYQQEDADPTTTLIRSVWVHGGTDPLEGTLHPGCVDPERGLCELPEGLAGPKFSFATVDPSPTKWWAIQWWIYTPQASNQLWLMDLLRARMGGNELLDWDLNNQTHYGVLEDWQRRSVQLGLPITDWIVEINAAQRFLLQYQFVHAWQRVNTVNIRPHETTVRKLSPEFGVDMVRDWWRFGRIRLPYKPGESRLQSLKLIDEATKYPKGWSDDQVMAHWFAITHLPRIAVVQNTTQQHRPSWINELPTRHLTAVGT